MSAWMLHNQGVNGKHLDNRHHVFSNVPELLHVDREVRQPVLLRILKDKSRSLSHSLYAS